MRTKRPAASASDSCQRCTAVLLAGTGSCTLCGWPVGVAYPPVDESASAEVEVVDTEQPVDEDADQEAQEAQLDALASMAARRRPVAAQEELLEEDAETSPTETSPAETVAMTGSDTEEPAGTEGPDAEREPVAVAATVAVAEAAGVHARHAGPRSGPTTTGVDPLTSPLDDLQDGPSGDDAGTLDDAPTAATAADTAAPVTPAPVDLWSPGGDPSAPATVALDDVSKPSAAPSKGLSTGVLPRATRPVGVLGRRAAVAVLSVPVLSVLGLLLALLTVVMIGNSLDTVVSGGDPSASLGTAGLFAVATLLVGLAGLVVWVLAAVFFLMWVHAARATVVRVSAVPQRWSPSWAVFGWLIPLFNVYLGWQVLEDLWRGSDPALRNSGTDPRTGAAPTPVLGWLACTGGALVLYLVNRVLLGGSLIGSLLGVAAVAASAYFLCRVIAQVSQWQDEAVSD